MWPHAVLIKRFEFNRAAAYPDFGMNNEVYTDGPYLEVETLAHQKEAEPLFDKLEELNARRERKLSFGANFTVTSTFIRNEAHCREFLQMLRRANVVPAGSSNVVARTELVRELGGMDERFSELDRTDAVLSRRTT